MKQSRDLLSVHLPPENQQQKLTDICFLHMSKPLKLVPVFCIKNRSPRSGPVTWKWLFGNFGSLQPNSDHLFSCIPTLAFESV